MLDLDGTASIVTGGASGIGEAVARQLASLGARVVVVDLNDERGAKVASDLGGAYVRADVADPVAVVEAVEAASSLRPLRTLVCSAGVGAPQRTVGRDGTFETAADLDRFAWVVRTNTVGTFNCIRLAATAMGNTPPVNDDGERGAIVTIASIAAFDGQVGQAAYSASKGGIVGMTLPVARDLASIGVRLNCVAPGLIDTPIYDHVPNPDEFKERLRKDTLFPRRLGTSHELASMVLELLTNSYANGEVVRLDAGTRLQAT